MKGKTYWLFNNVLLLLHKQDNEEALILLEKHKYILTDRNYKW